MLQLPPALAALSAWPQFVCWYAWPKPENPAKLNKFPIRWQDGSMPGTKTGGIGVVSDPSAWTTYETAAAAAPAYDRGYGSGVGFVFTAQDPFFFADLDGVLTDAGEWSPLAMGILARFPGAAVEVSHSGKGLHIIGRSAPLNHSNRNIGLNLELYTADRFVALTGDRAIGDANTDHTAALAAYAAEFFPPRVLQGPGTGWTDAPVPEWRGPTDDAELVRRATASGNRTAAQAFGGSTGEVTFADLWEARTDALATRWPGEGTKPYDASSADQALANHLAFWTGKDCARMDRLMRQSGLVREKWDQHSTYLMDTITKACSFVRSVLTAEASAPGVAIPPPPADAPSAETAALHAGREMRETGREHMFVADQVEHFGGCFYLLARNEAYCLDRDVVLGKAAFDVLFGGHLFIMDPSNAKTTDSAWEAYTKSRVCKPVIVDDLCFRPELTPGALLHDGRRVSVNSYVPYDPRTLEGDASPFLNHLRKMLPDDYDRSVLLGWMARIVQSPGRKVQWWPVIQGTKGNGKTALLNLLAYAMGESHTHLVNVEAMAKTGNQFSDWLNRKTFVGIEEIKVADRREFLELLKPVVTNWRVPMEGKGTKQFTGDNRANGVILTNYPDGVPIDDDERRYGIFFTAQQSQEDKIRDGMDGAYFADWMDWWRGEGRWAAHGTNYGFAVATHYLRTYAIAAEFDPALHDRAPRTSSTATAVAASLGRVEQEVLEAIDEGRTGFAGGWVSSTYLDALIDQQRAGVPRAKRRGLMQALGYDWHPALRDGRVNNTVMPDNKKPRLYVRNGHVALAIEDASGVATAYERAQQIGAVDGAAVVAFGKAGT